MKRRFGFLLVFFLLCLCFSFLGCDRGDPVWELKVIEYELSNTIPPDEDYAQFLIKEDHVALLIYVEMKNLKDSPNSLSFSSGTFYFRDGDESYEHKWWNAHGYLPREYQALEKKTGYVAFEVPKDITVHRGTLGFIPREGPGSSHSMTFVPKKR